MALNPIPSTPSHRKIAFWRQKSHSGDSRPDNIFANPKAIFRCEGVEVMPPNAIHSVYPQVLTTPRATLQPLNLG